MFEKDPQLVQMSVGLLISISSPPYVDLITRPTFLFFICPTFDTIIYINCLFDIIVYIANNLGAMFPVSHYKKLNFIAVTQQTILCKQTYYLLEGVPLEMGIISPKCPAASPRVCVFHQCVLCKNVMPYAAVCTLKTQSDI